MVAKIAFFIFNVVGCWLFVVGNYKSQITNHKSLTTNHQSQIYEYFESRVALFSFG